MNTALTEETEMITMQIEIVITDMKLTIMTRKNITRWQNIIPRTMRTGEIEETLAQRIGPNLEIYLEMGQALEIDPD